MSKYKVLSSLLRLVTVDNDGSKAATGYSQTIAAMQPMMRLLTILTLTVIHFQVFGQKTDLKYLDNSVNEITLRTPETVENVFGQDKNYVDQDDDQTEVVNNDGKQLLTMIFYPGGTINDFYAFRVSYNTRDLKPNLKIETKDFVTGKNIKLGLTENQVKNTLGTPTKIATENGLTIWRYETEEKDDLYFGRYDFRDGKLIQFWFGEEYP
jgi:hypothetical protein